MAVLVIKVISAVRGKHDPVKRALSPIIKKLKLARIKQTLLRFQRWFADLTPDRQKTYICLAVLFVVAVVVGTAAWMKYRPAPDKDYSLTLPESTALENHTFFGGDVYWGRKMYDWSQQSRLKEAYPFSGLHELQPEIYDAWVVNLECPSVPTVKQPIGYDPGLIHFNCDSKFLPEAAKWFDVVSLANNHISNQGREPGQEATRKELDKNHMQYFGGFNPHKSEDICDVVSLPARARLDGKQQNIKLPIAMCGYHGVYYTITDKAVQQISKYAKYMPVIAYPHMGTEYQAAADNERRALYQKMIDAGAEAVLANHPHWAQETEVYKGRLIVYSMGNFIFDQDFSTNVQRAAAIDVIMSLKKNVVADKYIEAWANLGKSCHTFRDKCLQQARQQNLPRLPLQFSYDIVGIDTSNRLTRRADNKTYEAILDRLKWDDVKQKGIVQRGHVMLR